MDGVFWGMYKVTNYLDEYLVIIYHTRLSSARNTNRRTSHARTRVNPVLLLLLVVPTECVHKWGWEREKGDPSTVGGGSNSQLLGTYILGVRRYDPIGMKVV